MQKKKLPLGIENFEKLRSEDFYYIDKTDWIVELLRNWAEVTLFTRPRRFGKTLNMNMLKSFFSIHCKKALFDGMKIMEEKELCEKYMGKFPVILISLKGIEAMNYEDAFHTAVQLLNRTASEFDYLEKSDILSEEDKVAFKQLLDTNMNTATLMSSLLMLSRLLAKHHGAKTIILIDEYDVPLAKAFDYGYYDQMVSLISGFLGNALKTNDSLQFAVLTGCMRISKESIFTGLNNFKIYSITDKRFNTAFGFTDDEVRELLHYYDQDKYYETVKEWYDGYHFSGAEVYCPWDVINFCSDHLEDEKMPPKNYWANTSGNSVINHFIDSVDEPQKLTRMELERLVNGGIVQKEINQELTYNELYASIDNLWSTLFMTGYLTQRGEADGNRYSLVVPNREIRNIITDHILKMFKEKIRNNGEMLNEFCDALKNQEPEKVEELFTEYMKKTISIRDTFVQKPTRENFYHGILLGILGFKEDWSVLSNREAGNGFSDILIQMEDEEIGILIEVKYADDGNLEKECEKALHQIMDVNYVEALEQEDVHTILKYGIACYKKKCKVMLEIEKR
nr:AAA family ATPase [uncultured Mediterraneibacter sp.]